MLLIRVFAFLITSLSLSATAEGPRVYRNDEFGITVPVPEGTLFCVPPEDQHDHGPVFLIGNPKPQACDDIEHNRHVVIFASYNAAEVTKKLQGFLKWECAGMHGGTCHQAPEGLSIPAMATKAGKVNRSDGWIDIIVVTQAGKPAPDFDPLVPSVNYDLTLHTKPPYLEEDLRIFRAVLSTVRLAPQE
ncbi:MAG: hypothetical protein WCD43_15260 [Candidatus Acidiferrales bacterium]